MKKKKHRTKATHLAKKIPNRLINLPNQAAVDQKKASTKTVNRTGRRRHTVIEPSQKLVRVQSPHSADGFF